MAKKKSKSPACRTISADAQQEERRKHKTSVSVVREFKTREGAENLVRAIRAGHKDKKYPRDWTSFIKDVSKMHDDLEPTLSTSAGCPGLMIVEYAENGKVVLWSVDYMHAAAKEQGEPKHTPEIDADKETDAPPVKKTKSGVRINLWGFGGGEICRWMGKHGFTTAQATAALEGLGCPGVAPPTIRLNLASGRQGIRGAIPTLTDEQAKSLMAFKE